MKDHLIMLQDEISLVITCLSNVASVQEIVDGGKNPSQQRGSLPVLQVPIRLMNIWYGRPTGIMDLLPSK